MSLLIDVATLQEWQQDPELRIFDVRYSLQDAGLGLRQYQQAHIPGAQYVDLGKDLSGPVISGQTGRHPLPDVDQLVSRLQELGVSNRSRVVLYDDGSHFFVPRLWWMLSLWLGHKQVFILRGGMKSWLAESGEVSSEIALYPSGDFQPRLNPEVMIDAASIPAFVKDGGLLLDARAPERYRGEIEPLDVRAGHIPGAHCLPCAATVDEQGHFQRAEKLRELFSDLEGKDVVYYCGSGVSACQSILGMVLAGLPPARLYPGSWSEWITDGSREIATGE
ncbi:sulfurtransferase [Parendozoicomonas haliclonae]|uniref:Sulfurtransferase n=1 Tax=Parendozoicomonas haliclonae TaxID=1960125 RepID=A0A1X7AHA6_9GAMM|nr:sulfurtransferase [Parendozoicomonas haliclonae]SMA42267.1 3-mercaptopyruvate sulfurtransferase [Parendozoicomonas haliclonae]